ncbi:NADH-ubiquinone oxidoreductase assembly factor N7BML [Neolecta irregularis DAH-3]|uniref:NADH-ubiquinone oxidoreductase assembly factor N7BML n=1 Tax=Neolecta irregularis (strain DAH-3) TaxID=1198029 RepID=A0A1U7LLV5_NEOID|nr:NADH-ubiquinone oxidoreductase assembly factor N7BML [Neolecta irregularis DAH-3]|eukprot:OLL23646.1 NADH-ubiquinone oxidoreductase assembly factor N7BML [Neolecta irregularis DAH-3]
MVAQWLNWLRYTRWDPPTLAELHADRQRIARIQILAQCIDEKWSGAKTKGLEGSGTKVDGLNGNRIKQVDFEPAKELQERTKAPGEQWKPESWTPQPRR